MALPDHTNTHRCVSLSAAAAVIAVLAVAMAGASVAAPVRAGAQGSALRGASPGPGPQSPCSCWIRAGSRHSTLRARLPRILSASTIAARSREATRRSFAPGEAACGQRGFLRGKNGRFLRIDVPGAGLTSPLDVNDGGRVVGNYQLTGYCPDGADPLHGFLRDRSGRITRIDVPGAVRTQAIGINNRDQVVGDYLDADGGNHGYLWEKGRFTTVDAPGASATTITDANDRGQMVGAYLDASGTFHAFFRDRAGSVTTIDAPGVRFTIPFGINNRGQIAGIAASRLPITEGVTAYGFVLAEGADGPLTRIDFPSALGTLATDIDDRGRIVGIYGNPTAAPDGQRSPMRPPTMTMMSGR